MQKPSGGLFFQTSLMAPVEYPPPPRDSRLQIDVLQNRCS